MIRIVYTCYNIQEFNYIGYLIFNSIKMESYSIDFQINLEKKSISVLPKCHKKIGIKN